MSEETTDFFDNAGGGVGAPSAVLKEVGDFVHGEIVSMVKQDYYPYGEDAPEKRSDGTNRQQLAIVLQTELRNWDSVSKVPLKDPSDESKGHRAPSEDDGKRAIYVPENKNIQFAIARAVSQSGGQFRVGGTLGVKVADFKPSKRGKPYKDHAAVYSPPSAANGFFEQQSKPAVPVAQPEEGPSNVDPWSGEQKQVFTVGNKPPF